MLFLVIIGKVVNTIKLRNNRDFSISTFFSQLLLLCDVNDVENQSYNILKFLLFFLFSLKSRLFPNSGGGKSLTSSTKFLYLLISCITMSNVEPIEDDMDDIDPSEMWTAEEREEYFREMDECPLLMSEYTEVGNEWSVFLFAGGYEK